MNIQWHIYFIHLVHYEYALLHGPASPSAFIPRTVPPWLGVCTSQTLTHVPRLSMCKAAHLTGCLSPIVEVVICNQYGKCNFQCLKLSMLRY